MHKHPIAQCIREKADPGGYLRRAFQYIRKHWSNLEYQRHDVRAILRGTKLEGPYVVRF